MGNRFQAEPLTLIHRNLNYWKWDALMRACSATNTAENIMVLQSADYARLTHFIESKKIFRISEQPHLSAGDPYELSLFYKVFSPFFIYCTLLLDF
jgi:hypothetical protein